MENIYVSIIIPVYNKENYIDNCINELKNQSLKNIEIIFVDDASTDNSLSIIDRYAKEDKRIKVIELEKNCGTCVARKKGVLASKGKYIMFLDADDILEKNACEIVYKEFEKKNVDILQFGTKIQFSKKQSREVKNEIRKVLEPCTEEFESDIWKRCFIDKDFFYTLWNKAYNAELCKKAFVEIEDEYIVISEDLYTFFILAYFSRSFRGISDKLYIYNFGVGITNNDRINLQQFKKYCSRLKVIPAIQRFLEKYNCDEIYFRYLKNIRKEFFNDIAYQWRFVLSISDADNAYNYMINLIGAYEWICVLARNYWHQLSSVVDRIARIDKPRYPGKKVETIGIYYHRIRNGGVEKVISMLIPMWIKLGYSIILITDEKPQKDDYSLPNNLKRVIIPNFINHEGKKYRKRAKFWENVILEYNIDTIVYNSCNCTSIMWDSCMIKGMNCNLIVETHSMFSGTMWYSPVFASVLPQIYRLVDRVVTLSTVDSLFWNNYCPSVCISNPVKMVEKEDIASLKGKNIIWVGRISPEKKPNDILYAFEIIKQTIKNATLTIVGEGDSPDDLDELIDKAYELNIEDSVEFVGYTKDVSQYYKKASVIAITSQCESFSMVLAESKGYGIPAVMYELPNLELIRRTNGLGVIEVPQKDILALANNIIELLVNDEKRMEMGINARNSIQSFCEEDIAHKWLNLFNSIDKQHNDMSMKEKDTSLMLDILFKDFLRGTQVLSKTYQNTDSGYNYLLHRIEDNEIVLNRHEEVVNRHEEVVNRHEEVVNRHEEVVNRHEEVVNRHEEVVNRHEEVVNRHEEVINNDWEWLKEHENRIKKLESKRFLKGTK